SGFAAEYARLTAWTWNATLAKNERFADFRQDEAAQTDSLTPSAAFRVAPRPGIGNACLSVHEPAHRGDAARASDPICCEKGTMKKFLLMGVLALTLAALSQQSASAWVHWKFGIGMNIERQSGGNEVLWGVWRNGQPPGPQYGSHGFGYPF